MFVIGNLYSSSVPRATLPKSCVVPLVNSFSAQACAGADAVQAARTVTASSALRMLASSLRKTCLGPRPLEQRSPPGVEFYRHCRARPSRILIVRAGGTGLSLTMRAVSVSGGNGDEWTGRSGVEAGAGGRTGEPA